MGRIGRSYARHGRPAIAAAPDRLLFARTGHPMGRERPWGLVLAVAIVITSTMLLAFWLHHNA